MRKNYDVNATPDDIFFNHSKSFKLVSKAIKKIDPDRLEIIFSDSTQNTLRGYDENQFSNILHGEYSNDLAQALNFSIYHNEIAAADIAIMAMKPETKTHYQFSPTVFITLPADLHFQFNVTIAKVGCPNTNPFFFTTLLRELKRAAIYDYTVNTTADLYQLVHLASIALAYTGVNTLGESDSYHNAIGVTMQVIRRWRMGPSVEVTLSDLDRTLPIWTPSESAYQEFYKELIIGIEADNQ